MNKVIENILREETRNVVREWIERGTLAQTAVDTIVAASKKSVAAQKTKTGKRPYTKRSKYWKT